MGNTIFCLIQNIKRIIVSTVIQYEITNEIVFSFFIYVGFRTQCVIYTYSNSTLQFGLRTLQKLHSHRWRVVTTQGHTALEDMYFCS